MALIVVSVETKNGDTKYAGSCVLNTAFMTELECVETTKCRFLYFARPEIKQGSVDTYVISQSRAWLKGKADFIDTENTFQVGVYPDEDTNETPVQKVFHFAEVVRVIRYPEDHDLSWMWLNHKGRKVERYLIDQDFRDIPSIERTGSTSTTTTTTSSTSTSTSSTSTTTAPQ